MTELEKISSSSLGDLNISFLENTHAKNYIGILQKLLTPTKHFTATWA